ncbi:hypothetical protein M0R45_036397 [Rubus argutus]|uniref:Uncharacterized protein n=1 Tax=Rubus argutus TaxID=59490 RepID=A0AAW1W1G7_RUBAR
MVDLLWARVRDAGGDTGERRHGPLVMAVERCSGSREEEPVSGLCGSKTEKAKVDLRSTSALSKKRGSEMLEAVLGLGSGPSRTA